MHGFLTLGDGLKVASIDINSVCEGAQSNLSGPLKFESLLLKSVSELRELLLVAVQRVHEGREPRVSAKDVRATSVV